MLIRNGRESVSVNKKLTALIYECINSDKMCSAMMGLCVCSFAICAAVDNNQDVVKENANAKKRTRKKQKEW